MASIDTALALTSTSYMKQAVSVPTPEHMRELVPPLVYLCEVLFYQHETLLAANPTTEYPIGKQGARSGTMLVLCACNDMSA